MNLSEALEALKPFDSTVPRDALAWLRGTGESGFDIAFVDPPFDADLWAAVLERLPARMAAEAWLYLGAAYGIRVQYHAQRTEYFAAARDGKRINQALERTLALDPDLADANAGLGLYQYYADIAPSVLKIVRWFLGLPGGDRLQGGAHPDEVTPDGPDHADLGRCLELRAQRPQVGALDQGRAPRSRQRKCLRP